MSSELQSIVARSLRWQGADPQNWIPERPGTDHDVLVVGGGQTGIAIAYGLRRQGVTRVSVIDQARPGEAGVWETIARMERLRTQKTIAGPELGNPVLGFRAWFESLRGAEAFDALTRISRMDWARYIEWYQQTVGIRVRHETRLLDIEPAGDLLRVRLETGGQQKTAIVRKLVLATGFAGAGEPNVPRAVRALPKELWSHTSERLDFARFKDRTVAVVGAATSAFDAAATALEHGATAVHLFCRRPHIDFPAQASVSPLSGKFYPGADRHFFELPDAVRWRHQLLFDRRVPIVPLDSILRAVAFGNFHLHLSTPWPEARIDERRAVADIGGASFAFDYVIAGTGYRVDLSARPELARLSEHIALWKDRYQPPPGEENSDAGAYPYLGTGFEFQQKRPGEAPFVENVHCYNTAASLSSGKILCDIPSMVELPRLVSGITRDLFLADLAAHERRLNVSPAPRNDQSPYAHAIWPAAEAKGAGSGLAAPSVSSKLLHSGVTP